MTATSTKNLSLVFLGTCETAGKRSGGAVVDTDKWGLGFERLCELDEPPAPCVFSRDFDAADSRRFFSRFHTVLPTTCAGEGNVFCFGHFAGRGVVLSEAEFVGKSRLLKGVIRQAIGIYCRPAEGGGPPPGWPPVFRGIPKWGTVRVDARQSW